MQRAFSVILVATVVIWLLNSFDFRFNIVSDNADSMMASIANVIKPVFKPAGLDDWRIVTSLISGFMAKESVVSIMRVLFGSELTVSIGSVTAACMLVFSLLYTPCVAAVASIKRELGAKWALYLVLWQCALAWLAACIVRLIALI